MAACLRMVVMWFVHLCSFGPFAVVCRLFSSFCGVTLSPVCVAVSS